MRLYAGINLHATNNYLGIIDEEDRRVFKSKLSNNLDTILLCLNPYKEDLMGVVVESTFNWYWLVDGLIMNDYKVHLANPAAMQQYKGLKYTDDKWDSLWLANMLRLNILPESYIYPSKERPLRDLLRKRLKLVREKTSHILSLKSMFSRNLGINYTANAIKKLKAEDVDGLFNQSHLAMSAKASICIMESLTKQINIIEKEVMSKISLRSPFHCLVSVPGIGKILALTIMLEVGDINRFKQVGNYSSYCRCVTTDRLSNGKSKGKGNRKNGNKYLSWAYVEASNKTKRFCPHARSFYQRKKSKQSNVLATKALSNKLSRATYYIMRDQVQYDSKMLFS